MLCKPWNTVLWVQSLGYPKSVKEIWEIWFIIVLWNVDWEWIDHSWVKTNTPTFQRLACSWATDTTNKYSSIYTCPYNWTITVNLQSWSYNDYHGNAWLIVDSHTIYTATWGSNMHCTLRVKAWMKIQCACSGVYTWRTDYASWSAWICYVSDYKNLYS